MMNIEEIIRHALEEDIGNGDHTSLAIIPRAAMGKSQLLVKENGVLAGVEIARLVYRQIDASLQFDALKTDGSAISKGEIVFYVTGSSRSILTGERLALNFMQRMSGIATATSELVSLVKGTGCRILDTRKTTPILREFEKMAVRFGGGENHRMGLYDMILIKDNHIDFAGGIKNAIDAVHEYMEAHPDNINLKVEIEVRNFNELDQVLTTGSIDRIMLDNFSVHDLSNAVKIIDGRYQTEASGGITKESIRDYAETGVNFISAGALTHHIKSLDMSLKAVV